MNALYETQQSDADLAAQVPGLEKQVCILKAELATLRAQAAQLGPLVEALEASSFHLQEWTTDGGSVEVSPYWSEGEFFECLQPMLDHVSELAGEHRTLVDVLSNPDYRVTVLGEKGILKVLTATQAAMGKEKP